MDINELLAFSVKNNASDLHLSAGSPPLIRVDGELKRVNLPALSDGDAKALILSTMNEEQQKHFHDHWELDYSIAVKNMARFRVNAFHQSRGAAAVFRAIPNEIPSLEDLGLPAFFREIAQYRNGLVLLTGPTGSGKSTTIASVIDHINKTRYEHILTIEDPIEFLHGTGHCLINQREVSRDTKNFNAALRSALREDPDVILIGELRDLETIRLALTAAETGHLVFGTLHTNSAARTINRIIDVFPAGEKSLVRAMLSESLRVVISQTLIRKNGGGRVAALEMMMCNSAIKHLIREDKVAQMYSVMQTSKSAGMQTLDQHLNELVKKQIISQQMASIYTEGKQNFNNDAGFSD